MEGDRWTRRVLALQNLAAEYYTYGPATGSDYDSPEEYARALFDWICSDDSYSEDEKRVIRAELDRLVLPDPE